MASARISAGRKKSKEEATQLWDRNPAVLRRKDDFIGQHSFIPPKPMNSADKWRTRAKKKVAALERTARRGAQSVGSDECRRIESDQIVFAISIRGQRWQERRCVLVRLIGSYVNTSSCRVPLVRPVTGQKYFAPLHRCYLPATL